jgi:hypothetical protein
MTAMPEATESAQRAPVARVSRRVLAVLRASNWQLNTGAIVIGVIVLAAILAPLIAPYPPRRSTCEQV